MARVTVTQQNFSGGELSPELNGRYDLSVFYTSASYLQNIVATTQGVFKFRNGSKYSWNTAGNNVANIIEFEFNTEQAYVLEFTDLKMRIYRNGGVITEAPQDITAITQANPAVVTYDGADNYANGNPIVLDGIVGMSNLNGKEYKVANVNTANNTFELQDVDGNDVDSSAFSAYVSGGTVAEIVEVTSPYTEAQLFEIDYAQTADTMYIVHPSHAPRKLTRTSHTSWTLSTYSRTADPFTGAGDYPSVVEFFEQRLMMFATDDEPQAVWGSQAGSYDDFTTGTDDDDAYKYTIASGKVNRIVGAAANEEFLGIFTGGAVFRMSGGGANDPVTPSNVTIKPSSQYGAAAIKPVNLDSHTLYVHRSLVSVRSYEYDALQDGFTSINRNLIADRIAKSADGNGFKQMAHQQGQYSVIWAVATDGRLLALTFEPREQVNGWHRHKSAGTNAKYLSVASIPQDGENDQVYTVVERTINGQTRRYVEYFADQPYIPIPEDYYTGQDNKSADTENWLRDMFEAQKRLFFVDSGLEYNGQDNATEDLTLSALTGDGITVTTSGSFFSSDDVGRQIWGLQAGRAEIATYVSATEVTVNVLSDFTSTSQTAGEWYFTANQFSGIDHLEGETLIGLADGGVVEDLVVSNGTITLANERQASYLVVGLQYTGIFKSMNLEGGGNNGPSQTKPKIISRLGIRFLETLGARFGTDLYKLDRLRFRSTKDKTGRPPPLFTGSKVESITDRHERDKFIYAVQDRPLPMNVQLLSPYMKTNDT